MLHLINKVVKVPKLNHPKPNTPEAEKTARYFISMELIRLGAKATQIQSLHPLRSDRNG
jgi:hypothetical protein